ncbi:unknown [Sinorhizobium phage PBC5]|nr:unknown [Sinorhizobium phage PBC5]
MPRRERGFSRVRCLRRRMATAPARSMTRSRRASDRGTLHTATRCRSTTRSLHLTVVSWVTASGSRILTARKSSRTFRRPSCRRLSPLFSIRTLRGKARSLHLRTRRSGKTRLRTTEPRRKSTRRWALATIRCAAMPSPAFANAWTADWLVMRPSSTTCRPRIRNG